MDIRINNKIEAVRRAIIQYQNIEYSDLYEKIENAKLKEVFATLHFEFIKLFDLMNERLPTNEEGNHYWADPSRELSLMIDETLGLHRALKSSELAFEIDKYYYDIMIKCRNFLSKSGGSTIAPYMDKIDLFYEIPIFRMANNIEITSNPGTTLSKLKVIGTGSYAKVFQFKDSFYNKKFVLKRANKDLNKKELQRFKLEYEQMKLLDSPYVIEVFNYIEEKNEYIMEYMDKTLDKYISENNTKLTMLQRKNIGNQILRGFKYLHSKGLLHRDISPKNILVKEYEDIVVVKISDFGLVKVPNSTMTSIDSDIKGYFNDPVLVTEGFSNYDLAHEIYALTRILFFILTGKTNTNNITNPSYKNFIELGLHPEKNKRYKTIEELAKKFREL
ncbi:protein kinase family protein [Cerasibacillus sp. JNUCC 74]